MIRSPPPEPAPTRIGVSDDGSASASCAVTVSSPAYEVEAIAILRPPAATYAPPPARQCAAVMMAWRPTTVPEHQPPGITTRTTWRAIDPAGLPRTIAEASGVVATMASAATATAAEASADLRPRRLSMDRVTNDP